MDKEINIQLSAVEVNGVLNALAQMPYAQVFGLIAKIQGQASEQIKKLEQGA